MYWNRTLLKNNAKQALKNRYWTTFLACLLCSILINGKATVEFFQDAQSNLSYNDFSMESALNSLPVESLPFVGQLFSFSLLSVVGILGILLAVLGLLWGILVRNPMVVAQNRYMMENRGGKATFETLFSVFRPSSAYLNVVKVMFLQNLEIALWSLLLVIPGIYKSYCYYYIPYLLAENPHMSYTRAKELSTAMTQNEKFSIFVLEISFIGWYILGSLIVIGGIFVDPYFQATFAELYAAARAKALDSGISTTQELAGFGY